MKKKILSIFSLSFLILNGCAKKEEEKYTVTWLNCDGSVLEVDENLSKGTMPQFDGTVPTKDRDLSYTYTFNGWSPKVENVSKNQTYIASFISNKDLINFSISYDLSGGVNSINNPNTYTIEDAIILENPTKKGYEFSGWFNENDEKIESISGGSYGNISLKAKWVVAQNDLTVSANDASKGTVSITKGSGYSKESTTVVATPKENCIFTGWFNGTVRVSNKLSYSFKMPEDDYSLVAHFYSNEELDAKYARKPVLSNDNKTVTYGLYPQSNINDEIAIATLDSLQTTESNGWYFYNDDYYAKVTALPYFSNYKFSNGVDVKENKTYWFKCEPIQWDVLKTENDEYLLTSSKLLDLYSFNLNVDGRVVNNQIVYSNNYKYSDLRAWLNGNFYNSAFSFGDESLLVTEIDNNASTTGYNNNPYACENTNDKVFALSYQDYLNTDYGFNDVFNEECETRMAKVTDYAKAKGAYGNRIDGYIDNGYYFTRSPHAGYKDHSWTVDYDGKIYAGYRIDQPASSVRPCISIKIEK